MRRRRFSRLQILGIAFASSALGACDIVESGAAASRDSSESVRAISAISEQELAAHDPLRSTAACRRSAEAYLNAIEQGRFSEAAKLWRDPVEADTIRQRVADYEQPLFKIGQVHVGEGADHCVVIGVLSDSAKPHKPLRPLKLVLRSRRASEGKVKWFLQSSTFLEEMERVGLHAPA